LLPLGVQLGWAFVSRRTIIYVAIVAVAFVGWRFAAQRLVQAEPQPAPAVAQREACLQRIVTWEARKQAGELHRRQRPPSC
jgi:hypothetical protein